MVNTANNAARPSITLDNTGIELNNPFNISYYLLKVFSGGTAPSINWGSVLGYIAIQIPFEIWDDSVVNGLRRLDSTHQNSDYLHCITL